MKVILSHSVIVKAPGLLPMLYKPSELAAEIGIPLRTLYDWLYANAPYCLANEKHYWINGEVFAGWVQANRKKKPPCRLNENEVYCFHCNKVVTMEDLIVKNVKGALVKIGVKASDRQSYRRRGMSTFIYL